MTLDGTMRGFTRATTTAFAITALAISPAAANAATHSAKSVSKKHTAALREAKNAKPAKAVAVAAPAPRVSGLGSTLSVGPTTQLAAMQTAITASLSFYTGL